MSDRNDSLKAAFARLDAERAATWPRAQRAANIAQRRTLVERFDLEQVVRVGDRLDDALLLDLAVEPLSIAALVAGGRAVLIFFRFATCGADAIALPYYDKQLRPALARIGVPVIAISPQIPERLGAIIDTHALGLTVVSDPDNRLARRLGITFAPDEPPSPPPADWIGAVTGTQSWELPMPTVLVLDRHRIVRFVEVSPDWLDRPEASTILSAVTAIPMRRSSTAMPLDRNDAVTDFPAPFAVSLSRRGMIGAAGLALLAACGKRAGGDTATLYAGDQKGGSKVVLDAADKLKDLPYRIEWSAFPNAAPLLEALNAGAIDTGIGGDSAFIFAIGTGAAIKAIGAQKYKGRGSVLVVPHDSAIRSLKDIAGKRIATPRGSVAHNFILAALEAQGKPLDVVHFAFLSPQDGQAALQGGSVDGWAIWDPNAALAEKDGARVISDEALVPSYALLFASDAAIAAKRPLLQDYARRLYLGWDWAVAHPDAYAELLHKETGIPFAIWKSVTDRTVRTGIPIDATLIADQQKTADRYLRAGLIASPIDVRKGFDASFKV